MAGQSFKDDEAELTAMAKFYGQTYEEVYFVRDLEVNVIVAVECYPAVNNQPVVMRNGRRFNCFNYKNRLLSSRERLDLAPNGKHMIGYESVSGNDTRLGKSERGVVAESVEPSVASMAEALPASSPFEKYQLEQKVLAQQAEGSADYELTEKDGMTIERFESFAVERVK